MKIKLKGWERSRQKNQKHKNKETFSCITLTHSLKAMHGQRALHAYSQNEKERESKSKKQANGLITKKERTSASDYFPFAVVCCWHSFLLHFALRYILSIHNHKDLLLHAHAHWPQSSGNLFKFPLSRERTRETHRKRNE